MTDIHVLTLPDGHDLTITCTDADGNDVGVFDTIEAGIGLFTVRANLVVRDCTGAVVSSSASEIGAGAWWAAVPPQGLAVLTR